MAVVREVELDALLELRARVLTPGHPHRPVVWPYDHEEVTHYGAFVDRELIGCVSITLQAMPGRPEAPAYHLHSMAVEPSRQRQGLGRELLQFLAAVVRVRGGVLIWATARPSAVGFYQTCGFEVGDVMQVPVTNATMRYVWCALT